MKAEACGCDPRPARGFAHLLSLAPEAYQEGVSTAYAFAERAHTGQVRKGTGAPYIIHPTHVASLVLSRLPEPRLEMVQAGLLHDVIEDTEVGMVELVASFGRDVGQLVGGLTDLEYPGVNRAGRVKLTAKRLGGESGDVQDIKRLDVLCNVPGMAAAKPGFVAEYAREKVQVLSAMKSGNRVLAQEVLEVVSAY